MLSLAAGPGAASELEELLRAARPAHVASVVFFLRESRHGLHPLGVTRVHGVGIPLARDRFNDPNDLRSVRLCDGSTWEALLQVRDLQALPIDALARLHRALLRVELEPVDDVPDEFAGVVGDSPLAPLLPV